MREIARIRNENNVEVTKLKRLIDGRFLQERKENKTTDGNMFVDNEQVLERRQLIGQLNAANSRLRACENLLAAGTQDKVKFMEGASWICKKIYGESVAQKDRLIALVTEMRARDDVNEVCSWIGQEVEHEANVMSEKIASLSYGVNQQLSEIVNKYSTN